MNKKALGRGLNALFDQQETDEIREIDMMMIRPCSNQPRKRFDENTMKELALSIKRNGLLQPILLTKDTNKTYMIVAGERRWRAAKEAGLTKIPAIVRELNEEQVVEISLIENLQREDLNAVEEARAFERLQKEFHKTQEEIAQIVGKSRTAIANALRILQLDESILKMIEMDAITAGHARAILSVPKEDRPALAKQIEKEQPSVRVAESMASELNEKKMKEKKRRKKESVLPEVKAMQESLQRKIGTKVTLQYKKGRGQIVIHYYNDDDLERIVEMLDKRES